MASLRFFIQGIKFVGCIVMLDTTRNMTTVLVADDDSQALRLLVEYLDAEEYHVITAKNGNEAWNKISDESSPNFDAIILDRNMPYLSGMDILSRLKSDQNLKNIPVIFQTGMASENDIIEGVNAGVYYYLTKPYVRKMLLSILNAAVGEYERYLKLKNEVNDNVNSMSMMQNGQFHLRSLEEARILSCMLANACPRPSTVVTGLSELLINAIEHGNLGISYQEKTQLLENGCWRNEIEQRLQQPENGNKYVNVSMERINDKIVISIIDQGDGFDPSPFMEIDPSRATHPHGRGVALARMISFDNLEYSENGNMVIATINLGND